MIRRLAALLALVPGPALAHHAMGGDTPTTLWQGLASGLAHPLIGADHLAFVLGLGLVSALAGLGQLVPVAAMAAMAAGVLVHVAGLAVPGAEALIALSVVLVGLAILAPRGAWTGTPGRRIAALLTVLAVAAAVLHGYAHGESIVGAEPAPLAAYLAGLAGIQALLSLGVYALARRPLPLAVPRLAGAAIVLVGVAAGLAW